MWEPYYDPSDHKSIKQGLVRQVRQKLDTHAYYGNIFDLA